MSDDVGTDYLDRAGPCPAPCMYCQQDCLHACPTYEARWRWLLQVREGRLAQLVELNAPKAVLAGGRKRVAEAQERLRLLVS
jgi:hypothetical protein